MFDNRSIVRLSCDTDLLYITHQIYDFPPNLETTKDLLPEQYMTAQSLLETEYLVGVAGALVESRVEEEVEEWAEQKVDTYKARRSSIKDLSSELMTPDILVTKVSFSLRLLNTKCLTSFNQKPNHAILEAKSVKKFLSYDRIYDKHRLLLYIEMIEY